MALLSPRWLKAPAGLKVFDETDYSIFAGIAERVLAVESGAPQPSRFGVAAKPVADFKKLSADEARDR